MKAFALWRKEIKIGFASPIFYAVFSTFLFLSGIMFFTLTKAAARQAFAFLGSPNISLMDIIFRPLHHDYAIILMFLTPWVTMRLFAEEKRSGTLELLFTYPFRELDLLAGKFLAVLFLFLLFLTPTLFYPYFLRHYTPVEWRVIGVQYLGLFLLGCSYLALGVWASLLTDNQIIAAAVTFGMLLLFLLLGWFTQNVPNTTGTQILNQLDILNHLGNFGRGVINLADVSFYFFFTGFFLYLSWKALEARNWWGTQE